MEVANYPRKLEGVSCSPRSRRIGRQWRENEVLLENPHSERTILRPDVRPVVTCWTYALEPRRTVDVR